MQELVFETKKRYKMGRNTVRSNKLVRIVITVGKGSKKDEKTVRIRFANRIWANIDENYMKVAVLENRLYFAKSDSKDGWAVSGHKSNPNCLTRTVSISNNDAVYDWARDNGEGEYELLFDKDYQLYYIEKANLVFEKPKKK